MAHRTMQVRETEVVETRRGAVVTRGKREAQAFSLLYVGFIVAPIVAGVDKFFHYLVDWNIYVSPAFASVVGGRVTTMMNAVGVVEVLAGLLVAIKPRLGGIVVAAWLWGIIVDLLLIPGYYDIALRDFGLSLGALALSRLAADYGR